MSTYIVSTNFLIVRCSAVDTRTSCISSAYIGNLAMFGNEYFFFLKTHNTIITTNSSSKNLSWSGESFGKSKITSGSDLYIDSIYSLSSSMVGPC
jgi:hypothetical protein